MLDVQRLAEVADERLGGRVDGEVRDRLERGRGRDVHEVRAAGVTAASLEEAARELDERDDVELEELGVALPLRGLEAAEVPEAGVVDEDVDGAARDGVVPDGGGDVGGAAEVARDDVDADAVAAALGGHGLQRIPPARREHEIGAAHGELLRDARADATGGAGDEGALAV